MEPPIAAVFGCSSSRLTKDERAFFKKVKPFGLILFERNCINPEQVVALINEFKEITGRLESPVFVDQEGGRVTRLKPPDWRHPPKAFEFATLLKSKGQKLAKWAIKTNYRLIADELRVLGIQINCAPILDIPIIGADPVIGDRALGDNLETIELLAKGVCEGLMEGGILPVIKHVPGHGRSLVDSHKALPIVHAHLEDLKLTDFEIFKQLNHIPLAMTAHVIYTAIDKAKPATLSRKVIQEVIREYIEYDGLLLTDDLSMDALRGELGTRAQFALASGCDLVLHCNGKLDEMVSISEGVTLVSENAWRRWEHAKSFIRQPSKFNTVKELERLGAVMSI